MSKKHHTKLVQVDDHVAEVDIEIINEQDDWSPHLSVEDAHKLDTVRQALKIGDFKKASTHAFTALHQSKYDPPRL